ncbi:MAG: B12-binding domain-containing radical SAM protein [Pirellula sp.]|nr:B12-binding domain-containing radical SAM protein [Pirellula sp.]
MVSTVPERSFDRPQATRCLLVYPEFTLASFWNFRAACELRGAKYPSIPLGLLTVAGMLPASWNLRLVDCNVETLADDDIAWADLVFVGGMLPQQPAALEIIERAHRLGKRVVVGGPDATSSPHVYDTADYQVLGEAEITLPRWLNDFQLGSPCHRYEQGEAKADVSRTPPPRFDLIRLDRYLYPAVQFGRGCPFLCEFCDIIELFGRIPRLKQPEQMLKELDVLYAMGHRGHVDFVDDNFVGNKRDVKKFLPQLIQWQRDHNWPFEFSTEASINLADDEELLKLMQTAGFAMIFVGIESPDEETLRLMQKRQNTKRSIVESLEKIYDHGMVVNTGYIIGFDNERGSVAQGILDLINAGSTPVNMVGLLFALPGTQLTRRLAREGRLHEGFERVVAAAESGDQCSFGINFDSTRPRVDILRDLREVVAESYSAENYFDRVRRVCERLNCSQKQLNQRWRDTVRDLTGFWKLNWIQGIAKPYRRHYWRMLTSVARRNPKAIRYAVGLAALYLHFAEFSPFVIRKLDQEIRRCEKERQLQPATA